MPDFNLDTKLTIPCPEPGCGHEFKESVRRLKDNPELICPICSSTVRVKGDELKGTLRNPDNLPVNIDFEVVKLPPEG